MSLRDDIERAMREHTLTATLTPARRTASGVPIPENARRHAGPPVVVDYSDPRVARDLTAPGFSKRLQRAVQDGVMTQRGVDDLLTDLRRHRRAINNDRALPGEVQGRDDLPYLSMPYAPRETFAPGCEPGTAQYNVLRRTIDQLDAAEITEGIADRMHTASQVGAIEAREDAAPPTLRESVEAAASLHYGDQP